VNRQLPVHRIMSPEKLHGCGKYAEQPYPMMECPFSNMTEEEHIMHLIAVGLRDMK